MNLSIPLPLRTYLAFGVPLLLLAALAWLMQSSFMASADTLFVQAISADLVLTIPLLYLALIYPTNIPKTTVIPVAILGTALGMYLLPESQQTYLQLFKTWALPLLELGVLGFIAYKMIQSVRAYRKQKGQTPDFYTNLQATCLEILPKPVAVLFATEIAVFYYGFLVSWKSIPLANNEYSYHRKSGTVGLMGALIFIIAVETLAIHVLVERWSVVAAWLLTFLSIYGGIQILGFARSLAKRPIQLKDDYLYLRYGIMSEAKIPYQALKTAERNKKVLAKDTSTTHLSPLGELEAHNVVLQFHDPLLVKGLYGRNKSVTTLGLYVDHPQEFCATLQALKSKEKS